MEVGDLVVLNPIHFLHHDDCMGIIVEMDTTRDDGIYKVAWMNDSNGELCGWFHGEELEVMNESG